MLELRKHKNGKYYASGTTPDGQRIRRSLKTGDKEQARAAVAKLNNDIFRGNLYGAQEIITFDVAALKYVQDGGEARFILPIAREFEGRPLNSIAPHEIRALANKLYPHAKPATKNRQAIVPAKAVINWAHMQGWCGAIRVENFKVEKKKRNPATREEIDQIRNHSPIHLGALLLFDFQSGVRVGNTISVLPEHLDLGAKTIYFPKTKNGDAFTVWLTDEMCEILERFPVRSGRVF